MTGLYVWGGDVVLEPGDPDVWLEEAGRPCSGDDCDRCHAVPAQAYRVVCEHGCYDDGAWRYCGTCARMVAQGHVKFCEGWES